MPGCGGRRILGILELLMKNQAFDFFGQHLNFGQVRGNAKSRQ